MTTVPEGATEEEKAQLIYIQMLLDGGCKIESRTVLFGKNYVWMKDKAGTTFLERIPDFA